MFNRTSFQYKTRLSFESLVLNKLYSIKQTLNTSIDMQSPVILMVIFNQKTLAKMRYY